MNSQGTVQVQLGEVVTSCFVIMPFLPSYQTLYDKVIRPAVEETGMICIRADEVFTKSQITHEIWKQIRSCRLVLAELTGKNPNVLYELGLAHAIGKPSIIITRNQDDVPFDLKALRYLYYDTNDPYWGDNLRGQLAVMCAKVVETEDFGSILVGIEFHGKAIPTEPSALPRKADQSAYNLTGLWQGKVVLENDIYEYSWQLHLFHKDADLTGSLIVSTIYKNALTSVQEVMTGKLEGKVLALNGVSYTFLEQGNAPTYGLDSFEGVVLSGGDEIEGEATASFSYQYVIGGKAMSSPQRKSGKMALKRVQIKAVSTDESTK